MELQRLQSELQGRMEELGTRRELAKMSNATRLAQSEQNIGLKLATTAMTTAAKNEPKPPRGGNTNDRQNNDS